MGYGSYTSADWSKLKASRGINSDSSVEEIFKDNQLKDIYNPRFINVRESRDSSDSPESTPIILGFDVTGSMGYLAAEIAKNSLNKTITEIYDKQPVTNPHVMCAAFMSPVYCGGLQVTQFEADIRVVEQLLDLKVGFGGNMYSYDSLVWYFAAFHTDIDSYNKRGSKGFLFGIGDEICDTSGSLEHLKKSSIKDVYDDDVESFSLEEIYKKASEKYEIFHIVTLMGYREEEAYGSWCEFMPGRVAAIRDTDIRYLSEVITSLMQLVKGMSKDEVIAQWPAEAQKVVEGALRDIVIDK